MIRAAIIADDLTGALDTASPFACQGLRVHAALGASFVEEATTAGADVVAVSTNSRSLPGDRAAAQAKLAAEHLRAWRPTLVLKKVDSRLKGNVAAETAAVAEAFGMSRVVAAPAAPDQGRFVKDGSVEGAGVERPIAIDERMPGAPLDVHICDSGSDADLDVIAAERSAAEGTVFVCSRGLAAAFARRFSVRHEPEPFVARSPVMVAVGSRDPITAEQLAALRAGRRDAAFVEAPGGRIPLGTAAGPLIIFTCTGDVAEAEAAVAARFGQMVAAESGRLRPATLVLSGGDTALAVLRALNIETLRVRGEAAPGLPRSEIATADGRTITVISKSGGFGRRHVFSTILGAPQPSGCHTAVAVSRDAIS